MKYKNIKQPAFLLLVLGILMSSCYKKFDAKSYQPPFTVNGFTSSEDIGRGSLVAYWAFEGSYIDSVSGSAATGINTSFAAGFKGKAYQGSATGYVISDIPAAVKNMSSFTITYWLNTSNTSGIITPICISRDDQFWSALDMFYENGGRTATTANLKVHFNGQSEVWFTSGWITNPWDVWQNIALTYNAGTSVFTLFQGGKKIASQDAPGLGNLVFPANARKIIFGTEQFQASPSLGTAGGPQGWAGYLTGQMDEVRIYNKALTETELTSLIILQGKGK